MNDTNNEAAITCQYCGCKNPRELAECAGCGNSLPNGRLKGKSKETAVSLALLFGPLGLLYLRAWWLAFSLIVIAAFLILTHTGGLWVTIGGRILCAILAYQIVVETDEAPNDIRDSTRLLEEAARLESVGFTEAIVAYEEIVRRYPNTRAGRQAATAIKTLKKNQLP